MRRVDRCHVFRANFSRLSHLWSTGKELVHRYISRLFGQGIITDPTILIHVLAGAFVGWESCRHTHHALTPLVSQLAFASLIPHSNPNGLIINLVSAAIAQAGANQSGDLSYDLTVGHLAGARPGIQTWGQIVGSTVGAFITCAINRLPTSIVRSPCGGQGSLRGPVVGKIPS